MRQLLGVCIIWLLSYHITAQTYGNEWINYSQQYFKFPVAREGVYRIDSTTLASGFNLGFIDPRNFQLFIKGKEQRLYIKGESDGKINQGDYLEFYTNGLVGDVDSLVYTDIKYVPNPYVPLFNDTLYAFLTLNGSLNNRRYVSESDTATAAYPLSGYIYAERTFSPNYNYNDVDEYDLQTQDPRYTQSEGWGGLLGAVDSTFIMYFNGLNTYTASSVPAYLSLNFSGKSEEASTLPDHRIQTRYINAANSQVLLADTSFKGYAAVRQRFTLNNQTLGTYGTGIAFKPVIPPSISVIVTETYTILHYIDLVYPQQTDLGGVGYYRFSVPDAPSSSKSAYRFSNFVHSGPVSLYDVTDGRRIPATADGAVVRAVIPNSGQNKTCVMVDDSQVIPVTSLFKANQNGYFTNFKNAAATDPYVIVYPRQLKPSATAYKNYRQSPAGGAYNVIDADVSELYEQFAYGLKHHPLAIKSFVNYLKDSLPAKPRYVLLIGKAIAWLPQHQNMQPADVANFDTLNLVPTFGIPSADNLITANVTGSNTSVYYPEIPIGRIAARTNADINGYLAKVQQHESTPAADWKKRILHFVGGDDQELASTLAGYMDAYAGVISDTLFGGEVYTFRKNTTAPIQLNISDSIKNMINGGSALLTFFGHGSQYGFDQAIDDPSLFSNTGKYPLVVANSCYSGDIHNLDASVSENFVLAKQKGSIGFLSVSNYGFIHSLHNYTGLFYKGLSQTLYNKGIGDIAREASYRNSLNTDALTRFTSLSMTLHGDPAIRISNGDQPDYILKNNDVSFDIKTYSDSVGVNIHFKNAGKAIRDSIVIRVQRFYANGDSVTVLKTVRAPMFKDSLKLFMLSDFTRGIGLNHFNVKIDAFNAVTESNETNNATVGNIDVFIPGGDIMPVYPYKYAIVPKTSTITLKASTTDPFAPSTSYRLQLDTCDKFQAPLQTTVITSIGGVIEWKVNLPYGDSTIYFWRASKDSTLPSQHFSWRESSFQTIGTKEGWSQAHFNQFKSNAYRFVNYKADQRLFKFENTKNSIVVKNFWNSQPLTEFIFNNLTMYNGGCTYNGWNVVVFDSISGQPEYATAPTYPGWGAYNNWVCQDHPVPFYSFGYLPAGGTAYVPNFTDDLEAFLNAIPTNNYVLAYTTVSAVDTTNGHIASFSNSLYNAFESIGAVNIRQTPDSVPYILFGRKGMHAGQGHEVRGRNSYQLITLNDSIQTRWHNGYVASEVIGPASKWNSLHWRVKSLDAGAGDLTILKLVGIKAGGAVDTLGVFPTDSADVLALQHYADANTYPFLKLVAFMNDDVYRTSPQLKRWQVLYDQAPECTINPLKGFASMNDTLMEGDNVVFRFPIENISHRNFEDSLVVTYWIEDNNHNRIDLQQKLKPKPFAAGQVMIDTVSVNSYQLRGNNALWMYVNPIQNARYQREQEQFNNIGRYAFKVNSDITNPLLDVTFDGVRILNGDLVSAKPTILITLKDENKFLALNDTGAFAVFLQSPGQSTQQRIYFAQGLQFTPASLPKNSCSILYTPTLPLDGKYTLSVQAKDRSRNSSGTSNYSVQFEIDNHPSVTNVLNYPNPFTTATHFVFTLTGSEIPEVFTIQIMTITGKVVKEITRGELGSLHIGRNITDYAWDGRDQYGDRLANGVYLYRVNVKLNGSHIDRNATGADKFFTNNIGKMVLMR